MWERYECDFVAVTSVLDPEIGHCCCITTSHGLPRLPHYLYPQYMGNETASEVVEKLYSSSWFADKTFYGRTFDLKYLLHDDPFDTGFDVAPHIRNLSISCFVDRYRMPRRECGRNDLCWHSPYERRYLDQDELRKEFDELIGLEENKGFQSLEITFVQRNIRVDILEEALETFSEVYRAYRSVPRVSVRVEWLYLDATCSGFLHSHKRHLGKFFTEPRHTWKHRMLQFLERVRPKTSRSRQKLTTTR